MDCLSASVDDFLHVVTWVSELEALDAKLIRVSNTLWSRLEFAEKEGNIALRRSTIQRLGKVGDLRGHIAEELSNARVRADLQVLGQP